MSYLMVIGLEALVILYLTGVVIHLQDRLNAENPGKDD